MKVYKDTNTTVNEEEGVMMKNSNKHSFTPTFASARSHLDYSYHTNLVRHRQLLQDAILGRVVCGTESSDDGAQRDVKKQEEESKEEDDKITPLKSSLVSRKRRPWIVFTAGAMGVGKGYVLTQLQQNDLFPAKDFVKIDPDMLKSELPEMAGYLKMDRESAATKLHRESTQMADVLFEDAISRQRDVLVDGSLRDVEYYQDLFRRIHRDHPAYRIAILHVTADRNVILDRARQRAQKTGRVVPHDLLEESMRQVPRSVSILSKLADATHVIANNENKPLQLVSSHVKTDEDGFDEKESSRMPSWEDFARLWKNGGGTTAKNDDEANVMEFDPNERCAIELPIVRMNTVFDCAESHAAANNIWSKAYPNFCARCALACDGQCGICIHEQHRCACEICSSANDASK